MRNIVICDDDPALCRCLQEYVERLEQERNETMNIQVFTSGEALLAGWKTDTDILLLDIQMGTFSGLDAARSLRKTDRNVCIILVTAMTQYAMEGYEVHAFSFLKKPVLYERFRYVFEEALEATNYRDEQTFTLRHGANLQKVRESQILYIEAQGHDIRVVTENRSLSSTSSLAEFEKQLQARGFFRCHKGYLIHLRYLRQIQQNCVTMSNGDTIPLSKHRRREFLECFAGFAGVQL